MKTMIKILIGLSVLLLFLGAVSAAHNNEIFTAPSPLHAMGYNDFVDEQGHNIMISEYNDDNKKTWFENDTETMYTVEPYQGNQNIYLGLTDEDSYILEVVEKDGTKYIIGSWTPNDSQEDFKIIAENLMEFNKLNKVTPIEA